MVVVDREGPEPVYEQIARQVRALIVAGVLPAGFLLPSVRTVASDLGVNLNTVARAYRLLEAEGFLLIRERAGAQVIPPGREADREVRGRMQEDLRHLLARMRQAGIPPRELLRTAAREIRSLTGERSRKGASKP